MRPTGWPGAGGRGRARFASALSASNGSVRPFAAGPVRQRPSPSRSHASALSASSTSKTRAISCCARASSTGDDDLDAVVEVSRHQVGAPDQDRASSPGDSKTKSRLCSRNRPRTLRTRIVSLMPVDAGPQRTDASRDDLDAGAFLRRCVERVDDARIRQRVDLDPDAPVLAVLRDGADVLDQPLAQAERRDEDLAELARPAEAGQVVEEVCDVGGDLLVGGEEAEVLVAARGARVVVARCRRGRSASARRPRGARRASSSRGSSGSRSRRRRGRRRARARATTRCSDARRSAPSTRRGRPICLPSSDASISAGTSGESSLVRYTVALSPTTLGSWALVAHERLEARRERRVRMVNEYVAAPDLVEDRPVRRDEPRMRDADPRLVLELGPGQVGELRRRRRDRAVPAPRTSRARRRRGRAGGAISMRDDAEPATSSRTTSPKRRRCSSSSTASSRSSASSDTSKSALRVTRKVVHSTISIFGKSSGRKWRITLSSGRWTPRLPTGRKRGRSSGTFTRAKRSSPVFGSRTKRPRLSERPEMYGNGWPGPTASGVSTGKDLALETARQLLELLSARSPRRVRRRFLRRPAPVSARASTASTARDIRSSARSRISASASDAVRPSGERVPTPASSCPRRPATRTMKNSSRCEREDGAEANALEQRHARVAGELENARVEVERRQLPVEEPVLADPVGCGTLWHRGFDHLRRPCIGWVNEW